MNIVISETSDTPIYQQIFEQIRAQVLRGGLPPGTPLPPIRTVAKELRISVITVKKAWELLETQGFIATRVGRGTVITDISDKQIHQTRAELLRRELAPHIRRYLEMGFTLEEILETIQKQFSKDVEKP